MVNYLFNILDKKKSMTESSKAPTKLPETISVNEQVRGNDEIKIIDKIDLNNEDGNVSKLREKNKTPMNEASNSLPDKKTRGVCSNCLIF
jgi:hypothetical protein